MYVRSFLIIIAFLPMLRCQGQSRQPVGLEDKRVGGPCEGCEWMYDGMPAQINAVDTSAGWADLGPKLLIAGTVYQPDGQTPAPGVILYYYHTDHRGYYTPAPGQPGPARRHGRIRGWVKTDQAGQYKLYTTRPAPYPRETMPAHIHIVIKEPTFRQEYYVDEFVFDDDPLLTSARRRQLENRGGSGVLRLLRLGNLYIAEHSTILGLNIPNHPSANAPALRSGLPVGHDQPSFMPFHAFGPDKGSRACPVCKYGRYQGILYVVGNQPDWADIKRWLLFLEKLSAQRSPRLKVYFVYGNEKQYSQAERQRELEQMGRELRLQHLALTFVPSLADKESEVALSRLNPDVANTFILFRNSRITATYVAMKATPQNFGQLTARLKQTQGDYLHLPAPASH